MYNWVPPSFQNDLAYQKQEAMADKHGPEKTVTQCKNKIRNLKAAYKAAKEKKKWGISGILSVFQRFR